MVYSICKYYLGDDGEIDRYEDLFLLTQEVKAEKKYKEVISEDPGGVYTLEKYHVTRMYRGKTPEELLQAEKEKNGPDLKCFIIEATEGYPHRDDLDIYWHGKKRSAYFLSWHEKYDRDHRPDTDEQFSNVMKVQNIFADAMRHNAE